MFGLTCLRTVVPHQAMATITVNLVPCFGYGFSRLQKNYSFHMISRFSTVVQRR